MRDVRSAGVGGMALRHKFKKINKPPAAAVKSVDVPIGCHDITILKRWREDTSKKKLGMHASGGAKKR